MACTALHHANKSSTEATTQFQSPLKSSFQLGLSGDQWWDDGAPDETCKPILGSSYSDWWSGRGENGRKK
jgi:hypothetical protein